MTTPSAAPRRRPPLLMLVALAWLAAGALAVGGTFAPLFAATQTHTESSVDGDDESSDRDQTVELTGWDQHVRIGDDEVDPTEVQSPQYGIPIVLGAVVLFTGGLLGLGAAVSGSGTAWRWSAGVAGTGAAVLAGAAGTVGTVVTAYTHQFERFATLGSSGRPVDAGAGAGMWLLICGVALGATAVAVGLIGRAYLGPDLLRPVERHEEDPPTPPFGVPVIRPVGYD